MRVRTSPFRGTGSGQDLPLPGYRLGHHHIEGRDTVGGHHEEEVRGDLIHLPDLPSIEKGKGER